MRLLKKGVLIITMALLCFSTFGNTKVGSTYMPDSLRIQLLRVSNEKLNDIEAGKIYNQLGQYALDNRKADDALHFYELALTRFTTAQDSTLLIQSSLNRAKCHDLLNDYPTALELYFEYLNKQNEQITPKAKASIYNAIAKQYDQLGDLNLAYNYHLQSLDIRKSIQDSIGICESYYSLGSLFYYQNNFDLSVEYYLKTNEISKAIDYKKYQFNSISALGSTYNRQKLIDKGLEYNIQSLEMAEKLEYETGIAYALHNIGESYESKQDYQKALDYIFESLDLKEQISDKWGMIGSYQGIARIYVSLGQYDEAIQILERGLAIAQSLDSKTRSVSFYEKLAKIYELKNDPQKSLNYLNQYVSIKNSILNETLLAEMGNQKKKYEFQQKEAEIRSLKVQNEILVRDQEIMTLRTALVGAGAILLAVVMFLLIRHIVHKNATEKLLSEKNKEIELKMEQLAKANELVHTKNRLLQQSNDSLQNFAYTASHDLRAPLRTIKSYTQLLNRRYGKSIDEDGKEFMHYITNGATQMDTLLTDMLSYSRVDTATNNFANVETGPILNQVLNNLTDSIGRHDATIHIEYEKLPNIYADRTQIMQLFQNLVANAIKFRGVNTPKVKVSCMKVGQDHVFTVKDNGIGIDEAYKDKVFQMFERLDARGKFEGSGIGLATCQKIIQRHEGKIWLESKLGEGSTFFFSIPIKTT